MTDLLVARNLVQGNPFASRLRQVIGGVLTTSRLACKPDLLRFDACCPIPDATTTQQISFAHCCDARARALLDAHARLHVMWSGGIDSTVALVALLKALSGNELDRLTVYLSSHSIAENPGFYQAHIAGRLSVQRTVSKVGLYENMVVTGELGDQLFGSDLMLEATRRLGFESLAQPHALVLPRLFGSIAANEQTGTALYRRYAPIADEAPYPLVSAQDFLWWWNFSQKWQHVKYRQLLYEPPGSDYRALLGKIQHFFDTPAFQHWSITHPADKLGASIDTYKMPAKRYIVAFTDDQRYLTKVKIGSLCKVFKYPPVAAITTDGTAVDQAGLQAFIRSD
ncbi:hypothetical protein [Xanthomonas albilineans]|uniref:hypothetical protein n=1 Tax=Xanthomonas albilineans TaxID=29447 RepID=UPI0005F35FC3|nr:hypothetical protein [Xanthomonas albilineans]PPU93758.1 hypothetical protein XalbCFBP2523_04715 [Xanthomonas albilineans]